MINSIPSSHANTVVPYAPLGRQPVGQESADLKGSSFKALEQAANSARSENRRTPNNNHAKDASTSAATDNNRAVQERNKSSNKDSAKKEQQIKDQKQIAELGAIDTEVRAHERAHASVGGEFAGAPTYEFVKGPDGNNYAVGGEVSISTSAIPGDPEATIRKAQQIRAAADAPADPSPQDRSVAAQAASLENQARAELQAQGAAKVQEAEVQAETKASAQKADEEKQAIADEDASKAAKVQAQQQADDAQQRQAERIDILTKNNNKTIDITRHLVQIGAVKSIPSVGSFLNQKV